MYFRWSVCICSFIFNHTTRMAVVSWSVLHPELNSSATIRRIVVKCWANVHRPQRMNPTYSGYPVTLSSSTTMTLTFLVQTEVSYQILDGTAVTFRGSIIKILMLFSLFQQVKIWLLTRTSGRRFIHSWFPRAEWLDSPTFPLVRAHLTMSFSTTVPK